MKRFCFFLLFSGSFSLFSQFEPLRNFSVKDGLPSGVVYDCLQDKQGFMWFATAAGLARFDGINFKVFTTEDGLTNNEILQIGLDKDGSIWIFPFGATACIYDPSSQKVYNESNYGELKKLNNLYTQLLLRNSAVGLVGSSIKKTFFFENKKIRVLDIGDDVNDIWLVNKDTLILFAGKNKTCLYTNKKYELNFPISKAPFFPLSPDWGSWKVIADSSFTALDLYQYTSSTLIKHRAHFEGKYVINSVIRNKNNIYISTVNGVYVTDTLLRVNDYFSAKKNISRTFVDRNNNEWSCSLSGEGVFMRLKNGVRQYVSSSNLPDQNISSVKINHEGLMLCGDGSGNIYTLQSDVQDSKPVILKKIPEAIRNIHFFNNSLIAYSSHRLIKNNKVISRDFGAIKTVIQDTSGSLLIGSHVYLALYNNKQIELLNSYCRYTTLCFSQNQLYYGNDKGLFKIINERPYKDEPLNCGLPELKKPINYLASSKDGILWVATNNDGIIALKNDKVIGKFNTSSESALSANICKKIFVDEQGQSVWVATNKGVNRILYKLLNNTLIGVTNVIASSEGLNDDDVNDVYVKDGMVYAATIKGICIFNSDLLKKSIPVFITDIFIKDYLRNDTSAFLKLNYDLKHWQNNISITYAGICFTCNKLNYKYRLLGNDADTSWKTTSANTVELGELLPGHYTFQVRTTTSNQTEINFYIHPPFWRKGWFYILEIAGIVLVFFFTVWYITKQVKRREVEKTMINKKFAELEFQALQAQMNPHFIFNVLNTLQNYILKNESENANEYLAKFARLMRLFLESSRNKFIKISSEIELLQKYIELEQARVQPHFKYQLIIEPDVELDAEIPSAIIQPFVENAILHGLRHRVEPGAYLTLHFSMIVDRLKCSIQDNGVGRQQSGLFNKTKDKPYQSQGINIINEKIRTLRQINNIDVNIDISDSMDDKGQFNGTIAVILFSLNK